MAVLEKTTYPRLIQEYMYICKYDTPFIKSRFLENSTENSKVSTIKNAVCNSARSKLHHDPLKNVNAYMFERIGHFITLKKFTPFEYEPD